MKEPLLKVPVAVRPGEIPFKVAVRFCPRAIEAVNAVETATAHISSFVVFMGGGPEANHPDIGHQEIREFTVTPILEKFTNRSI